MDTLVWICCFCSVLLAGTAQADSAETSHDHMAKERFTHRLLEEHRYQEALSLLEAELETHPPERRRLTLLFLMTDAMLGIRNLSGAEQALSQAQSITFQPGDELLYSARLNAVRLLRAQSPDSSSTAASGMTGDMAGSQRARETVQDPVQTLISNSFFDTDLRQVLSDVSLDAGVPILWDPSVSGFITYEAVDKPLDEVLKAILLPLGYTFICDGGVYYVGSADPAGQAFGLLSKTEVVTLSNLAAKEAVGLLNDSFQQYVKPSATSNLVCITAPPTLLARIRGDLQQLDLPQDLILIEVILSEISTDALKEMGLDWSLNRVTEDGEWSAGTDHANLDAAALVVTFSGASLGKHALDLAASLEALVQSGDASIRSSPRITTLNGRPAEINLTREQYFIIQTGGSEMYRYNTLESVSSGIKLEITPWASEAGEVSVLVSTEVGDVVGKGSGDLPEISRRTANTSVRVQDGETFTIGGLRLRLEEQVQHKVPILGSIPLLGALFRHEETRVQESEMVIFITPHILKR